jgi:hypothetical protein
MCIAEAWRSTRAVGPITRRAVCSRGRGDTTLASADDARCFGASMGEVND